EELRPRRLQPKAGAGDAAGGAVDGEGDAHRLSSMRRTASARIGASGAALVWWAIESVETIVRAPAAFTRPVASGVIKAWATATSIEAAPARFAAATARTNVSPLAATSSINTTGRSRTAAAGRSATATSRSPILRLLSAIASPQRRRDQACAHGADSASGPTMSGRAE